MSTLGYDFLKAQLRQAQDIKADSNLSSPLYYMLTGRRGAWLYRNHHSTLITCMHPHINDRLMVFPEVGRADYALTASVLNMMSPPANGIQLARYSEADLRILKGQIASQNHSAVSGLVVSEENSLDWRYPVHVLDAQRVADMEGADFGKIRTKFRKAAEQIDVCPIENAKGIKMMKAALKFWEGNMIFNDKDTDDMSEMYEELFKTLHHHPDNAKGLLFMQGRRPVGFTMWDEPYQGTSNFLVNLCDISVPGLSEFQFVSTCRALREEGVMHVNVGGSELQSLDAFKLKFKPAQTLKILSADVVYHQPEHPHIQVHTIIEPAPLQMAG